MSARVVRWSVTVCLWVVCLAAVGCGRGAPIQSPLVVQAARTPQMTEQAILDTLPKRGWTAENVQPGRVVAFLSIRRHLLRTEIRYDAQQINIYYVDSDNLAAHIESDGQIYAHPNVNRWIQTLASDIASALAFVPQPSTAGAYQQQQPQPQPMSGEPAAQGQPAPSAGVAPPANGLAAPAVPLAH